MRGKVTLQQIADLAGVSKFAVSRALSGKPGVSPQTRELILKTAGQLGYFDRVRRPPSRVPDPVRGGESALSGTVAVLFPNIRYQNRESPYWGPVFDGIAERLEQIGLDVVTMTEPSDDDVFRVLNPTGLLGTIGVGVISTQMALGVRNKGIPIVMVDHQDPAVVCDTVFMDNFACTRELVGKLIGKGFRAFQFVGQIDYSPSFYERWLGFRSALEDFRLPFAQAPALVGDEAGYPDGIRRAIEAMERMPEVFVCANDATAVTVIEALRARGVRVPEDCAVTGFDNTEQSAACDPPLTTVDVPKRLLGMRAVDKLLWRIRNPDSPPEKTLIYGQTVWRASTERR